MWFAFYLFVFLPRERHCNDAEDDHGIGASGRRPRRTAMGDLSS